MSNLQVAYSPALLTLQLLPALCHHSGGSAPPNIGTVWAETQDMGRAQCSAKFHQKSLTDILRTHKGLQSLPLKQTDR